VAALLRRYLDSWWIPFVVTLVVGGLLVLHEWLLGFPPVSYGLFALFGLSVFLILTASIYQFAKQEWKRGLASLGLFLLALMGSAVGCVMLVAWAFYYGMFGPSEDGFGKDIVIPPNMVVEDPQENPWRLPDREGAARDEAGERLRAAFAESGPALSSQPETIDTRLEVLDRFASEPDRELLLRHLATSAKWFLTQERGHLCAYRRCVVRGQWQCSLNGYYTGFDFRLPFESGDTARFQFRVVVGPDGPVFERPFRDIRTCADVGSGRVSLRVTNDTKFGQGKESYLVLRSRGGAVEVFEQSPNYRRPFTPAALREIVDEFSAVLASPTARARGFEPALVPPESLGPEEPELCLVKTAAGGGIYQVRAYVNPTEKGYVYVKVFEATRGTPLSAESLGPGSLEYAGWSDDPHETFFYNTEVTVYEGDWGTFYPARFELWFVPVSGGPERKLLERIFRIEGWQR
jgi:hypothetical protein